MFSKKKKLDEFIRNFSGNQMMLRNLCDVEKNSIKREIKRETNRFKKAKESIDLKVREMFYNTLKLKGSNVQESKYKLDLLDDDDDVDFKFIKEAIDPAIENHFGSMDIVLKIHRVVSNANIVTESKTPAILNLLLLHGTKAQNVEGILKEGIKPSETGSQGPGIYLTNSFGMAHTYGSSYVNEEDDLKRMVYLFVNKVELTNAPKSPKKLKKNSDQKNSSKTKMSFAKPNTKSSRSKSEVNNLCEEYCNNEPFVKMFRKQVSFEDSPLDKLDRHGNKVLKGTFNANNKEEKVIVAHHDLVIPVYLIEIEVVQSLDLWVENILYNDLRVKKYHSKEETVQKHTSLPKTPLDQRISTKVNIQLVLKELEKEITVNHQAQVQHLKSKFDHSIAEVKQQLLFKVTSLFKTSANDNTKYKREILQTQHEDYKFILRSIIDEKSKDKINILHVFKIIPTNPIEVTKLQNSSLYFHGVKSNKVMNVLESGYPQNHDLQLQKCKENCFDKRILPSHRCSCKISNSFSLESTRGRSYGEANNELEISSYVFVVGGEKVRPKRKAIRRLNPAVTAYESVQVDKDSRGCLIDSRFPWSRLITGMIPAYLIVFQTNGYF